MPQGASRFAYDVNDYAERTATFASWREAKSAADAAMPRRKHNRPYPQSSGYHSARAGADRWIVMVGNAVLLTDGTMYDHARRRTIGG